VLIAALDAARRHRLLERTTLVYVVLPFLIFLLGWLEPVYAIPLAAVVLAGLYRAQRTRSPADGGEPTTAAPPATSGEALGYAVLLACVVVVVVYSGTGAYAFQGGGHFRNNSFLLDLISYPWPLGFEQVGSRNEPGVLAFYIGNALTPALVGRVLGWAAAFHFSFVWAVVGVFLAVCWFLRLVGRTSPLFGVLFLLFGGLDLVSQIHVMGWSDRSIHELDIWMYHFARKNAPLMGGMFWIFPSNLTILFSSPHHVLCTWLSLFLILDDAIRGRTCRRIGIVYAPALLWSAFGFVGMAPFVLVAVVVSRARGLFSFENLVAGPAILLVVGLYLLSNNQEYVRGPLWEFQDPLRTWKLLALVCALEFGIYALLFPPRRGRSRQGMQPAWWWTAVACLLVLPWYRMGDFCDFPTKAMIPSLVVLQVWLARALANARSASERIRAAILLALLIVGAAAAVTNLRDSARAGLNFTPPPAATVRHTNELRRKSRGGQLFSDGDAFFWRVLARPVEYQDVGSRPRHGPTVRQPSSESIPGP
jgi:hypothetical protein